MKYFIALVLLAGCSSWQKRAEELMENKAYREAAGMYEMAVREDAEDEDALAGLRKARAAVVDTELIAVRMARLGGNRQGAADHLLQLVAEEGVWSLAPVGAAATTQEEESAEASNFLSGDIVSRAEFPLYGLYRLKHYQPLLSLREKTLLATLSTTAKRQCEGYQKQTKGRPYFTHFVRKYCSLFPIQGREPASLSIDKTKDLYGRFQASFEIEGLPDGLRPLLLHRLENAFRKSPWFEEGGRQTLNVKVTGRYTEWHDEKPEVREHSYTIEVPYTAYVPREKKRQVPYTVTEQQCPSPGSCHPVSVTHYRTETYTENEPETRYQTVPKTYPYNGTLKSQRLWLTAAGAFTIAGEKKEIALTEKREEEGFEHNWNLPHIGLRPRSAGLVDPATWIQEQGDAIASRWSERSGESWQNLYCQPPRQQADLAATGELVHRCLRAKNRPFSPFVENWYESHHGLKPAQAETLIGFSDL